MTDKVQTRAQSVTAHFMLHWGVPKQIHMKDRIDGHGEGVVDLAVLEFGPRQQRDTCRFATNGMSAYIQPSERKNFRTEVYCSSRLPALWIVELLVAVAKYPMQQEVAIGEFNTIPAGGPIDGASSRFTGLLTAPPGPEDPDSVGAILDVTPETMLVHQLIGISENERQFAIQHGGEALWKQLLSLSRPLLLDEERTEAV